MRTSTSGSHPYYHGRPGLAKHTRQSGFNFESFFDADTMVDHLRLEHYPMCAQSATSALLANERARRLYYGLRPMLPDWLRHFIQRIVLRDWNRLQFPEWPVDTTVEQIFESLLVPSTRAFQPNSIPFIWFWPDGFSSAAIITHDVETAAGLNFIPQLIDVDDAFGIKSSFQLVPEQRYVVSDNLFRVIRHRGCEVNVHGLNHASNPFRDRNTFLEQARHINRYVSQFGAEGFRSPSMYRNADWYEDLHIYYDMSVPNVAHLEPQRGGCCTVFPYFIGKILELPLTTIQDYSLFHILREYSIELWKQQSEIIMDKHGLLSFIIHPDYLLNAKALAVYKSLLLYLSHLRVHANIWIARPGEVNRWWRQRSVMKLISAGNKWHVEGPGRERARVAFASFKENKIAYTVTHSYEAVAEPVYC